MPLNTCPPGAEAWERITNPKALVEALRMELDAFYQVHLSSNHKQVDYRTLQQNKTSFQKLQWLAYQLQEISLMELTVPDRMAFFINVYNLMVIHGIIVRGNLTSFWSRLRFYAKVTYVIGGLRFSLNDIEHGILRENKRMPFWFRQFSNSAEQLQYTICPMDPRIHFTINCGAESCPPIYLYDGEELEANLKLATESFVGDESNIMVLEEQHCIKLSGLFYLYEQDFAPTMPQVMEYLLPYFPADKAAKVESLLEYQTTHPIKFEYFTYNWNMNQK